MFASAAGEEKEPVENAKKDKNKFLRLGDIEGQEFGLGNRPESSESANRGMRATLGGGRKPG